MEIMVFKTSVETPQSVKTLKPLLDLVAGRGKWNFALDDCDRILRIASANINAQSTIRLLQENGYECAELED
ncbi:MAG TPA: hypothetical protein VGK39_04310 [Cyclobacteriaceae bacterium]